MAYLGSQTEQLVENCNFANLLNMRIFFQGWLQLQWKIAELFASYDGVQMGAWILAASQFSFRAIWNTSSTFHLWQYHHHIFYFQLESCR